MMIFKNSNCDTLMTSLLISPFNEEYNIYPKGKFVFIIDGIDELMNVLNAFWNCLEIIVILYQNSLG